MLSFIIQEKYGKGNITDDAVGEAGICNVQVTKSFQTVGFVFKCCSSLTLVFVSSDYKEYRS